jgi:hypothetical protein
MEHICAIKWVKVTFMDHILSIVAVQQLCDILHII